MSSSSVPGETPMTQAEANMNIALATYRLETQRKRIAKLERALEFREARIDELVKQKDRLRKALAGLIGEERMEKEFPPRYKPLTIISPMKERTH